MKKSVMIIGMAAVVIGLTLGQAFAQEKAFPTRQLNYMVCFDPGGQSDRGARLYQPHLDKLFGQKVIIDYKVGGGGALGWRELTRAKPDGYTFAGFNIPHIILQPLQQEVGLPDRADRAGHDLPAHAARAGGPQHQPDQDAQDFIDMAKKNPGAVSVGGSGSFSGYHMATLRLEKMTGTKLTYVPVHGLGPPDDGFPGRSRHGHFRRLRRPHHPPRQAACDRLRHERAFPRVPGCPRPSRSRASISRRRSTAASPCPRGRRNRSSRSSKPSSSRSPTCPKSRPICATRALSRWPWATRRARPIPKKMTALYKELAADLKK